MATGDIVNDLTRWLLLIVAIGSASAVLYGALRGLYRVSKWMQRAEAALNKIEKQTNGDLNTKFADVRRDMTDLHDQVVDGFARLDVRVTQLAVQVKGDH